MGRASLLVAVVAAALIHGGCSAEGNPVDVDVTRAGDSGRRVLGDDEDAGSIVGDPGTSDRDAGSGNDGEAGTDSSLATGACGFVPGTPGGTCSTDAVDIGSVSGDSTPSINTISYAGAGSQWLVVSVTEDVSGILEADLSVKLTLTSPPGTNYDLFGYVDPSGTPTSRSCQTVSGQSTNGEGLPDEITLYWDDNKITQPSDDTRLVSVRVEHVSGPCGPDAGWTLTVEGHTM